MADYPAGVLFGAAYCAEYQPYDRLQEDLDRMARVDFTVMRVGESVWSTWEPRDGESTSTGCTELVRYNLVAWTAGNVSGRVTRADLFVIKPSGVDYDRIAPDNMILCDLDGGWSKQNHGVFTIGRTPRAAVKAAVMCEDVARIVHPAKLLGEPLRIAQFDIVRLYERYQNVYGQR
jgi:hypothetical protein